MRRIVLTGSAIPLLAAVAAQAATVTLNLVPVGATAGNEVVVQPGTPVDFRLVVLVESDTTEADNQGLSLFQIDLLTNSGVDQQPLTAFADDITNNFTFGQSLGTPESDRITNIAGAQNLIAANAFPGIGVGAYAEIGHGTIQTPTTETSFIPTISTSSVVFVLGPNADNPGPLQATLKIGDSFTIRTSTTAGGGGTTDGTTTAGADSAIQIGIGAALVLAAAFWLFGWLGLAFAAVIVPLLGLLLLIG